MLRHLCRHARTVSRFVTASLIMLAVVGCSRDPIRFPYADERYVYPGGGVDLVRVHLGDIHDLRPEEQRRGQGHFAGITFR